MDRDGAGLLTERHPSDHTKPALGSLCSPPPFRSFLPLEHHPSQKSGEGLQMQRIVTASAMVHQGVVWGSGVTIALQAMVSGVL